VLYVITKANVVEDARNCLTEAESLGEGGGSSIGSKILAAISTAGEVDMIPALNPAKKNLREMG
jgi:hypothetical protein